jgi:hypothetical protein
LEGDVMLKMLEQEYRAERPGGDVHQGGGPVGKEGSPAL